MQVQEMLFIHHSDLVYSVTKDSSQARLADDEVLNQIRIHDRANGETNLPIHTGLSYVCRLLA